MSTRPIVLPDTSEIRLEVKSRSHNFMIAIDGEATQTPRGDGDDHPPRAYEAKMDRAGRYHLLQYLREN